MSLLEFHLFSLKTMFYFFFFKKKRQKWQKEKRKNEQVGQEIIQRHSKKSI
jgi:hypothetical protein